MAFNKKTRASRMARKRTGRRFANRKLKIRRAIGNPKQQVFFYNRLCPLLNFTADADAADALQSYTFDLGDVPGYTEYTALYDFYKLNMVVITFIPMFSSSPFQNYTTSAAQSVSSFAATNQALNSIRFFTCIDYNSAPALTIAQIREYKNCKMTPYMKRHTRTIRPRCNIDSDFQLRGKPWVNCDSPTLPHYSLVCGLSTSEFAATQIASGDILYKVEARYYVSFKGTK